jgi:hypothetical protein
MDTLVLMKGSNGAKVARLSFRFFFSIIKGKAKDAFVNLSRRVI